MLLAIFAHSFSKIVFDKGLVRDAKFMCPLLDSKKQRGREANGDRA